MTAETKAALEARRTYQNDGTTFVRLARKAHRCCGRFYSRDEDGIMAFNGQRCERPIGAGTLFVEYLGETAAYQNGKRYHPECAERDGLLREAAR